MNLGKQRAFVSEQAAFDVQSDVCSPERVDGRKARAKSPHVLLITLQGVEREQLGCFGAAVGTATLDRLAKEGLRFLGAREQLVSAAGVGDDSVEQVLLRLGYTMMSSTGRAYPAEVTSKLAVERRPRRTTFRRETDRAIAFFSRARHAESARPVAVRLVLSIGTAAQASLLLADQELGRLVAALERSGGLNDTLVMVLRERLNARPEVMIIRWPGRVSARGELRARCVSAGQVLTTLLGLAEVRQRAPVSRIVDDRPKKYVYHPWRAAVPDSIPSVLLNRAHRISARVVVDQECDGVAICHGSLAGGYALYIDGRRVRYVHAYAGGRAFELHARELLPIGSVDVRLEFSPASAHDVVCGRCSPGKVRLFVNGRQQAQAELPAAMPLLLALGGSGIRVQPSRPALARLYERAPYAYGYEVRRVVVQVGPELVVDTRAEVRAVMARQ